MQILVRKDEYDILDNVVIEDRLPVGNYDLSFGAFGRIYFKKVADTILPTKVYSNDSEFISHVSKAWQEGEGNVGVGLVGGKGLGKSFTANIIANQTNLPVIRITEGINNPNIFSVLNSIDQDFVLFIDEFEKLFDHQKNSANGDEVKQQDFLTFLDGGILRKNRIMFIITANNTHHINDFLKNRPSRLRYFKEYKTLHDSVIKEIVNDLLVNQEFREDLIENLPYDGLNIDVLIQIIKEINVHNRPYSTFKEFFNFKVSNYTRFNLMLVHEDGTEILLREEFSDTLWKHNMVGRTPLGTRIYANRDIEPREYPHMLKGYYYAEEDKKEETEIPCNLIVRKTSNRMTSVVF